MYDLERSLFLVVLYVSPLRRGANRNVASRSPLPARSLMQASIICFV